MLSGTTPLLDLKPPVKYKVTVVVHCSKCGGLQYWDILKILDPDKCIKMQTH
jgi:formylmethanofuran dehydrogenase subunit E